MIEVDGVMISTPEPREERAVRDLLRACFDGPAEARLVEGLRFLAKPLIELVARGETVGGGAVVGHVMLSPVTVVPEGDDAWFAWGLAPLAVEEGSRRRGIGAALVRAGLAAAVEQRAAPVFVLGDPAYYARFGFEPAVPLGFGNPFLPPGEADDAFQVLGLVEHRRRMADLGVAPTPGWLRYHEAFDAIDAAGGGEA